MQIICAAEVLSQVGSGLEEPSQRDFEGSTPCHVLLRSAVSATSKAFVEGPVWTSARSRAGGPPEPPPSRATYTWSDERRRPRWPALCRRMLSSSRTTRCRRRGSWPFRSASLCCHSRRRENPPSLLGVLERVLLAPRRSEVTCNESLSSDHRLATVWTEPASHWTTWGKTARPPGRPTQTSIRKAASMPPCHTVRCPGGLARARASVSVPPSISLHLSGLRGRMP